MKATTGDSRVLEAVREKAIPVARTRLLHLDVLRVMAIYFVLFNHSGIHGATLYSVTDNPIPLPLYLFVSVAFKVSLPLFFMLSGALLIPKEESIGTVYRKRVSRIVVVILLFSLMRYVYTLTVVHPGEFSLGYFLSTLYSSNDLAVPYWFLKAYLGLLIVLPLLRRLAKNMTDTHFLYLIGVQVVMVGFLPIFQYFAGLEPLDVSVPFITQAPFFFLVGYFVEHRLPALLTRKRIYLAAGVSVVFLMGAAFMTWLRMTQSGVDGQDLYFHSSLTAIPAITVYTLVKKALAGPVNPNTGRLFAWLGGTVFGVYLLEGPVRHQLLPVFHSLDSVLTDLPATLIYSLVVLLAAAILTTVLKQVPGLRKLL